LVNNPQLAQDMKNVKYEDIYKQLPKQTAAVKLWVNIFKIYNIENEKQNKQKET
jgi:hypothetical protein